jgi:hypothetical protein
MQDQLIPLGLCQCGCGQTTSIARQTWRKWGWVRGQPLRYVKGHKPLRAIEDYYREEDRGYTTPCWIWTLFVNPKSGYGSKTHNGRTMPAHVWVFELFRGRIPRRFQLDHLCRVRSCVNPDHLEPVTGAVNAQRGAAAKLTVDRVVCIRDRAAAGEKRKDLAREYGVAYETICSVIWRRSWK